MLPRAVQPAHKRAVGSPLELTCVGMKTVMGMQLSWKKVFGKMTRGQHLGEQEP